MAEQTLKEWSTRPCPEIPKRLPAINEVTGRVMQTGVPSGEFKNNYDSIDWSVKLEDKEDCDGNVLKESDGPSQQLYK